MSWLDKYFTKGVTAIQAGGISVPAEPTINFVGATLVDDPSNGRTTITVGGGTTPTSALSALAIDWSVSGSFSKTLAAGANTFTFANVTSGAIIVVRLTGAASTVVWPTVKWAGGVAPTQTASGTDVYTLFYDGTNTYGSVVQAFA